MSQSIRDTYSGLARYAGLEHIGGKGDRSIFEGTKEQWAHLKTLVLERATEYNQQSVKAALARIDWCLT